MSLNLSIGSKDIPPVEDDSLMFLGMPVQVYRSNSTACASLQENLQHMLDSVDKAPCNDMSAEIAVVEAWDMSETS